MCFAITLNTSLRSEFALLNVTSAVTEEVFFMLTFDLCHSLADAPVVSVP